MEKDYRRRYMRDFPWASFESATIKRDDWDEHENPDKRLQEVTLKFVVRPNEATQIEKWFAERKAMWVCPHCRLVLSQRSSHLEGCPNREERKS